MTGWIVPPIKGLIEPAVAPEFYIDICGAIEVVGSNVQFYLAVEQLPLGAGADSAHHVVIAKIIRPLAGLPGTIIQLAHCLDGGQIQIDARHPPPFRPTLVK